MEFLIRKGFVKHFRMKISDIKSERLFHDSMSSLSSSKYTIELNKYKWQKWRENI